MSRDTRSSAARLAQSSERPFLAGDESTDAPESTSPSSANGRRRSVDPSPISTSPNSATHHRDAPVSQTSENKRARCDGAGPVCGPCEENGLECIYQQTGKKRGPPKGYKPSLKRTRDESDPATGDGRSPESSSQAAARAPSTSPVVEQRSFASRPQAPRVPSEVLSTANIEHLLALYFAHTHVVWPIIYKPMFHHPRVLPVLLWSMLALAACVSSSSPTPTTAGAAEMTADELFAQALLEVQRYSGESRVELVQALVLLSLRQTGNGMKSSAWNLCGQACTMAIDLGLHNAGRVAQGSQKAGGTEEARRVFWNCFILDKTLSEETGRPYILRSRRCTTPLPSVLEPDEFEPWPPMLSAHSLPALARITPTRAHALTAFNSTCRLALIVERIMDLDEEGPCLEFSSSSASGAGAGGGNGTERPGGLRQVEDPEMLGLRDVLSGQLDEWWMLLPEAIQVQSDVTVCPLPHFVVNVAWYHSARILLHSRFINAASREYDRRSSSAVKYFDGLLGPSSVGSNGGSGRRLSSSPDPALVRSHGLSHAICTEAADEIVKLISLLDRWKLLTSSSSDVIHLVSHATLFQVYNSSLSDVGLANRAKMNFVQCCQWLKTFSSSWPAASHHKTFFEGLISGGLDLSPTSDSDPHINAALFPNPPTAESHAGGSAHTSPHADQNRPPPAPPSQQQQQTLDPFATNRPQGLNGNPTAVSNQSSANTTLSPTSFFKTPSHFWNQLVPTAVSSAGMGIDPATLQQPSAPASGVYGQPSLDDPGQWASPTDFLDGIGGFGTGASSGGGGGVGQDGGQVNNSVYDALMAYMLDSGRSA